jgi:hypothetical protein
MVVYHSLLKCGHHDSVLLAGLLAFSFGVYIAVRLQGLYPLISILALCSFVFNITL